MPRFKIPKTFSCCIVYLHDPYYCDVKALKASVSSQNDDSILETPVVTERLWVDKYSPSSFVELLSDEHTNREVHMQDKGCNDLIINL